MKPKKIITLLLSFIIKNIAIFLSIGLVIVISSLLISCENEKTPSLSSAETIATAAEKKSSKNKEQSPSKIKKFVIFTYQDPMAGMEAFSMLIPKGWKAEGSISWSPNPALPTQSHFRFYDPTGQAELNIFPTQAFFWTDNQVFLYTNPPGSLRFGTLVAKPVDLRTAFINFIIPQFRGNVGGLRIIAATDLPELSELAKGVPVQGVKSSALGGKIRIEYQQSEEEIYAAVSQFVMYQPASLQTSSYFINYWYIDYVFSLKAEKSKLDLNSDVFQTMLYSLKVNSRYFAKVANVKEMLAQMVIQNIQAVGRMGEMIARAGSEIRSDQQRAWEHRQATQDRIARNFSDYVRGVERYNDPHSGKEVELPSGYGHAWSNNLGEYIVTDSPSYNPNIGSNLRWKKLPSAD